MRRLRDGGERDDVSENGKANAPTTMTTGDVQRVTETNCASTFAENRHGCQEDCDGGVSSQEGGRRHWRSLKEEAGKGLSEILESGLAYAEDATTAIRARARARHHQQQQKQQQQYQDVHHTLEQFHGQEHNDDRRSRAWNCEATSSSTSTKVAAESFVVTFDSPLVQRDAGVSHEQGNNLRKHLKLDIGRGNERVIIASTQPRADSNIGDDGCTTTSSSTHGRDETRAHDAQIGTNRHRSATKIDESDDLSRNRTKTIAIDTSEACAPERQEVKIGQQLVGEMVAVDAFTEFCRLAGNDGVGVSPHIREQNASSSLAIAHHNKKSDDSSDDGVKDGDNNSISDILGEILDESVGWETTAGSNATAATSLTVLVPNMDDVCHENREGSNIAKLLTGPSVRNASDTVCEDDIGRIAPARGDEGTISFGVEDMKPAEEDTCGPKMLSAYDERDDTSILEDIQVEEDDENENDDDFRNESKPKTSRKNDFPFVEFTTSRSPDVPCTSSKVGGAVSMPRENQMEDNAKWRRSLERNRFFDTNSQIEENTSLYSSFENEDDEEQREDKVDVINPSRDDAKESTVASNVHNNNREVNVSGCIEDGLKTRGAELTRKLNESVPLRISKDSVDVLPGRPPLLNIRCDFHEEERSSSMTAALKSFENRWNVGAHAKANEGQQTTSLASHAEHSCEAHTTIAKHAPRETTEVGILNDLSPGQGNRREKWEARDIQNQIDFTTAQHTQEERESVTSEKTSHTNDSALRLVPTISPRWAMETKALSDRFRKHDALLDTDILDGINDENIQLADLHVLISVPADDEKKERCGSPCRRVVSFPYPAEPERTQRHTRRVHVNADVEPESSSEPECRIQRRAPGVLSDDGGSVAQTQNMSTTTSTATTTARFVGAPESAGRKEEEEKHREEIISSAREDRVRARHQHVQREHALRDRLETESLVNVTGKMASDTHGAGTMTNGGYGKQQRYYYDSSSIAETYEAAHRTKMQMKHTGVNHESGRPRRPRQEKNVVVTEAPQTCVGSYVNAAKLARERDRRSAMRSRVQCASQAERRAEKDLVRHTEMTAPPSVLPGGSVPRARYQAAFDGRKHQHLIHESSRSGHGRYDETVDATGPAQWKEHEQYGTGRRTTGVKGADSNNRNMTTGSGANFDPQYGAMTHGTDETGVLWATSRVPQHQIAIPRHHYEPSMQPQPPQQDEGQRRYRQRVLSAGQQRSPHSQTEMVLHHARSALQHHLPIAREQIDGEHRKHSSLCRCNQCIRPANSTSSSSTALAAVDGVGGLTRNGDALHIRKQHGMNTCFRRDFKTALSFEEAKLEASVERLDTLLKTVQEYSPGTSQTFISALDVWNSSIEESKLKASLARLDLNLKEVEKGIPLTKPQTVEASRPPPRKPRPASTTTTTTTTMTQPAATSKQFVTHRRAQRRNVGYTGRGK